MSNFRRLLVTTQRRLPYKEVLEYLESTGTQYIDTGLVVKANTLADFTFQFTEIPSTESGIFGTTAGSAYSIMAYRANIIWWFKSTTKTEDLNKHHVVFSEDGNCYKDGVSIATRGTFGVQQAYTMLLFASLTDNNTIYYSSSRIFNFKFYEGDVLTRDYIPVLDWNDVPCMYDRVNNKLYYNQGTGEFSYKRWDNISVDYIGGSGTQYIDTGIVMDNTIDVNTDYLINSTTRLDNALFGARNSKTATYYWLNNYGTRIFIRYNTTATSNVTTVNDNIDINCTVTDGNWLINNDLVYSEPGVEFTTGYNCYLFSVNEDGSSLYPCKNAYIKQFTLLQNNNEIISLTPIIDENGTVCFYDSVTNQNFYNTGTGNFNAFMRTEAEMYQIGNYIESSGTQYIDTNMLINGNYTIEAEVNPLNTGGFFYWGTGGYNAPESAYNLWPVNSNGASYWDTSIFRFYYSSLIANKFNKIIQNKDGVYVNGELVINYVGGVNPSPYTMWLFKGNSNNVSSDLYNSGSIQIKRFKLYNENNKLVLSLLPATRMSDNVVGMYDTISNSFFINSGTGDFIIG